MTKKVKKSRKCGIKKVWNPTLIDTKMLKFLYEFREGSRTKSMSNYLNIKTSTLYKRLNILKNKGLIINEYPLWKLVNGEVKFVESLLKNDNNIFELHHPAYVVKLLVKPEWWNPNGSQMRNKLMMIRNFQFKRVNFGRNSSNQYIQLKNDRYVLQMYPESVIVIHRKRYYSTTSPYDLTIEFMNDFYDLWEWFEERMKFKFFKDGVPQMTLRGHDYNRINDYIANYVKDKIGHKILIEIGDGRKVWIDLSEPFGKEANTPEIQEQLEKHTKDLILNKPMLNSELQLGLQETSNQIRQVTENQLMFNKNLESHVQSIRQLGSSANANSKSVELLADTIIQMKESFEIQINKLTMEVNKLNGRK